MDEMRVPCVDYGMEVYNLVEEENRGKTETEVKTRGWRPWGRVTGSKTLPDLST